MWRDLFLSVLLVAASVTGSQAIAQTNDGFANRLTLTGPAPSAVSNNLHATREAGEPNHAGAAAGRSLWYTWTAPTTGTANLGTYYTGSGAPIMRALAVYTGDSLAALSEVASGNNQAQSLYLAGSYSSPLLLGGTSINVPVTAGTVYQIAVDALVPPTSVEDDGAVVLAINATPTILSAAGVVGTTGVSFSYTVAATGGASGYDATGLPAGLIINRATGEITGVPSATGTSSVGLSATGTGGTGTAILTLVINDATAASTAPPLVASAASARAFVGAAFSFTVRASGSPTAFAAANLPAGLTLNAATGLISGTPTASGTFSVPLSVTNAAGTGTSTLTIAVSASPPPPIFTSALAAVGTVGTAFSYYITTNVDGITGAAPTGWTATNLPPGVTKSAGSNYFAGTPTQAGTFAVPIAVTNAAGTRAATVTVTIAPKGTATSTAAPAAPVLSSFAIAQGVVGTAFSYPLSASNAPTAYTASNLPAGLGVDATTGVISGTPTVGGTFPIPVAATNSYGTAAAILTLTICANSAAQAAAGGTALPVLVSPACVGGYVGSALTYTIMAAYQGGYTVTGGGTWTFTATGLPPGLSLATPTASSGYGTISGTPTTTGTYAATISMTSPAVTGGYMPRPAATSSALVTFFVVPAAPTPPLVTSAASVSSAVGSSVSYAVTASGSPTGYAATGLPPGLGIDAGTGAVSGTPTTAGTYQATVSATNAVGTGSATVTFRIILRPPVFSSSATDWATVGTYRSYTVSVQTPPVTYSADLASLPAGMSFDGSSTTFGQIYGTPTTPGTYTIPVSATNASGTTRMTLTFTVRPTVVVPIITADARMTGAVGTAFYNGLASNTPVTSYGATNLPPGVTLDPNGTLGGTPTAIGTYKVPVSATNAAGTGTATITMVISGGDTPSLGGSAAITAPRNQYLGGGVTVTNPGTTTVTYSGLPPGLFAVPVSGNPGAFGGTPNTAGIYPVKVTATNAVGSTVVTMTITITNGTASSAPVLADSLSVEQFVTLGSSTSLTLSSNPAATSYTANGLPPGLSLNGASGIIAGTPTSVGMYPVKITASNAAGSVSAVTNYLVQPGSQYPPGLLIKASVVAYAGVFHDNNNLNRGALTETYAAGGLPPGLSINAATGEITGTPTAAGRYSVDVSATNSIGTTTATWTYLVKDACALVPYFFSEATELAVPYGQPLSYSSNPYSSDYGVGTYSDNTTNGAPPPLTFTVTDLPAGASYTYTGTTLSITSGTLPIGSYPVTITATSSSGTSASEKVLFVVYESYPPVIGSAAAASGPANVAFSYRIYCSTFPDTITSYSCGTLPDGLTLNGVTGVISGTPTTPGTYAVPMTANAPFAPATAIVTLRVDPPLYGGLPLITSSAAIGSQDFPPDTVSIASFFSPAVSYTFSALNRPVSFVASNVPMGMVFNPSTGTLSGTPTATGNYRLPITATNAVGTFSSTLTIIANSPRPVARPALAYGGYVDGSFSAGTPLYFPAFLPPYATGTGYSAALDPVVYSAVGLPTGFSINTYTGQITGNPTQTGTCPATLTVANRGGSGSAVATFTIAANAPAAASAPVWSGRAEAAGFVGVPMSYALTASAATSFAATGLPDGLSLNPSTGVISGTPMTAGTSTVTVSAGNSAGTTQAALTVIVETAPFAPVLSNSGSLTATIGSVLSYNLTTANFSGLPAATGYFTTASALPAGLRLNAVTGVISGTPTGPEGTYAVPITVAVGPASITRATITLIVQPTPALPVASSAAGAMGLIGNPFSYAIRNAAFLPDLGSLPAGLAYDAVNGLISGYPQATGTFNLPLAVPGTASRGNLTRKSGVARRPVSRRPTTIPADGGGSAATAILTLNVVAPDASLPRLTLQPIGGTAVDGANFTFTAGAVGAPVPVYQWQHNGVALSGATGSSLLLSNVSSADAGDYTVTASNALGSVTSTVVSLTVQNAYAHWQSEHFTAQEIAAGLAVDNLSFSGDGVPNLLKYALGLDPRTSLNAPLPIVSSRSAADGTLQIEFDRDAGLTDINYLVEASTDLQAWTTIAQSIAGAPSTGLTGSGYVTETTIAGSSQHHVTVKAAASNSGSQFLRVRIVRP